MPKKLTLSEQWLRDHPDDLPCPRDPGAAATWRYERGIYAARAAAWRAGRVTPRALAEREKYRLAMLETRRAEASS